MGVDSGGHDWEGAPYSDAYVRAFQQRLEEVYTMRETNDELARLLGGDESNTMGVRTVFAPFAGLQPLQVSDFTAPQWRAAKAEYERRMSPIEQRISQKLKELFGAVILPGLAGAPAQVFQELKRYSGLLGRPLIAATLADEKDALAKQVDKHLDNLQSEFEGHRSSAGGKEAAIAHGGRNTCSVAERIMWCMQTTQKLAKVVEVVTQMLGGRVGGLGGGGGGGQGAVTPSSSSSSNSSSSSTVFSDGSSSTSLRACLGVAAEMSKEVKSFKEDQFRAWEDNVADQLNSMVAWKNSKLMTFDEKNAHVKTHFNDQLVVLLREVRQLQALGFSIKSKVMTEVETANKFYRYGMVLKQRANFYNNISTEMIPCQKPMMLADAMDFEKVLMNPRDAQNKEITWKNAAALDGYVKRLNDVADRLAEKNRQLRKWHAVLGERVVALMGTDLVRHKDKWAAGVKEMRDIFARLEGAGYSRESQMLWRQHWDFQLYKALEYQYLLGLEVINKTLPDVEAKMVFKQHKLQYEPPLEEMRIRHIKELLNTFLGLPLRMKVGAVTHTRRESHRA
ncbi:MAG: hypothetical protein WDW36_001995 [Sanguina aurantia]